MSLFRYIIMMVVGAVLCWLAWYSVVLSTNPTEGGWVSILLFYVTLTLALTGSFAVAGFFIRTVFLKQAGTLHNVLVSFRHGIFFSLLVDGFLYLQSLRLLTWYNVVFLIFALTLAEFFVITRRTVTR